jgi:lipoate-protein ligase A
MTGSAVAAIPFDLDDRMIERTREDGQPRVRVYCLRETAVVIGRGGKPEVELNAAAIRADGARVYKRPGGGCSVVLDPGNLIISVTLPLPGIGGIKGAFDAISGWLIAALAASGVPDVEQRGVSDLTIGDRKIGGSCVYRTRGLLYYSSTLLVDPDFELIDRYLPHPPREPDYRAGRRHRDFLVSLEELGLPRGNADLEYRLNIILNLRLEELLQGLASTGD